MDTLIERATAIADRLDRNGSAPLDVPPVMREMIGRLLTAGTMDYFRGECGHTWRVSEAGVFCPICAIEARDARIASLLDEIAALKEAKRERPVLEPR